MATRIIRELKQGQRVRVYYNLHKKCYSITSKIDGSWKLVAHADRVMLQNVKTIVSQAGRKRVLAEKRKNVHAFIEGDYVGDSFTDMEAGTFPLYYNPYEVDQFVDFHTRQPVKQSKLVYMQNKRAFYIPV